MSVFTLFTRAAWRAVFMPLCMTVLAAPGMAGAAAAGTQTFKAAVTTGTCTVPGSQMTQVIDFGNIPRLKTLSGSDTDAWGNTQIPGGALTPDAGVAGGAVTLNGAVHIYRVVKKGLVTSGTANGQINLTLISL
ncbi:hypothetical protein QI653_004834 [Salmonella enterica]|nr:hypothetical protein [Salmonella enterica]